MSDYLPFDHPRVDELFQAIRKAKRDAAKAASPRTHNYTAAIHRQASFVEAVVIVTGKRAVEWLDDPRLKDTEDQATYGDVYRVLHGRSS